MQGFIILIAVLINIHCESYTNQHHLTQQGTFYLLPLRNSPQLAKTSSLSRIYDHTQTHHTRQDSSGRVISSSQRPVPENTQSSQQTDIHAYGGIRTHNPNKRTAADPRPLDSAATGTGGSSFIVCKQQQNNCVKERRVFVTSKELFFFIPRIYVSSFPTLVIVKSMIFRTKNCNPSESHYSPHQNVLIPVTVREMWAALYL